MARILVLTGHPRAESFCGALAERYAAGARAAGHEVRMRALAEIPVDLVPPDYHRDQDPPTEWVAGLQTDLAWCEHWVIVAPMWWGGLPAALEAVFDRVLLPGFAFRYHREGMGWDKLMKGRSARVILTMDTPPWVLRWFWGRPILRRLKTQVLGFCGFSPARFTTLGVVRKSTPEKRAAWLDEAEALGRAGA
ncbi:NAD(P)H-dependent oxidoreductase [Pinisolibacter sp.]|uniref:NAD(P)H-dependent oxidoreductase n=1 Tax=Pinisolibacter sp. TaxID=2172024 RepID=UPI002FDEDA85